MEEKEKYTAVSGSPGRIWAALFLIIIGCALVLREMGLPFPEWLFTWPMILIVVGFYVGIKHQFRGGGWLVMLAIGGYFLMQEAFPEWISRRMFWPFAIIGIGILMLVRPKKNFHWMGHLPLHPLSSGPGPQPNPETRTSEEYIDSSSFFGVNKKSIVSKNFRGGEINSVLGGAEIDMSQAEIQGRVLLEVNQVMGATKLVVPAHWDIECHVNSAFGSVDDKRKLDRQIDPTKVLVIEGNSVFGGIEIKNI